jgi:hypothetical protein
LRERTYADACTETKGWSDTDADGRAVNGGLLMVLLLHDDLVGATLGKSSRGRTVEREWRRVAVDVGVVSDVGVPGNAGHWKCRDMKKGNGSV